MIDKLAAGAGSTVECVSRMLGSYISLEVSSQPVLDLVEIHTLAQLPGVSLAVQPALYVAIGKREVDPPLLEAHLNGLRPIDLHALRRFLRSFLYRLAHLLVFLLRHDGRVPIPNVDAVRRQPRHIVHENRRVYLLQDVLQEIAVQVYQSSNAFY